MKLFIYFILLYNSLLADKVYVIANQDVTTSKEELKKFFSAKSDYLDGKKFKRISNKEALNSLANIVFSINEKKLSRKWIKQNFRKGIPFPLSIKNNKQTIEWIKNHPSTIGFVTKTSDEVHVIYLFGE